MPRYQIVGQFADENAPPVCWGGVTGDKQIADQRLAEAEAYLAVRKRHRGQHIDWRIAERGRTTAHQPQ